MSTFADRNSPLVIAEAQRSRAEQEAADPPQTIAARVGRLVEAFLSPPYLGSMAGGSATEDAAIERWRTQLGNDAAELGGDAVGREPEAVRLIELIQYRAGFEPGTTRAVPSSAWSREQYKRRMWEIFG